VIKEMVGIIQPVGKFTGLGMREFYFPPVIRAYSFPKFSNMRKKLGKY